MQRHWPPLRFFSTVAVLVMTAVSASAAGNADEKAQTRYLGSPSGEYKLTVETTGDTTRATLKRLIIPNETLWHKDLSYLSAGHAGFIGDNGTVVLLNLRDGRFASSAVRIFRSDGSLLEEYTAEDIARTLKNSSPEHADVKPDQISTSDPPHLKYGRIDVPMGSAALLIDLDTGALTTRLETQ
jgi:hypothetical protein